MEEWIFSIFNTPLLSLIPYLACAELDFSNPELSEAVHEVNEQDEFTQ